MNPTSITIHNWGALNTSSEAILSSPHTTTHYVVEPDTVHTLNSPTTPIPHTGHPIADTNSIGIYLRPEATLEDYRRASELIRSLRDTYGNLPLYPHSAFSLTTCPGTWNLATLDSMSRRNYSLFRRITQPPTNRHNTPAYRLQPNTPLYDSSSTTTPCDHTNPKNPTPALLNTPLLEDHLPYPHQKVKVHTADQLASAKPNHSPQHHWVQFQHLTQVPMNDPFPSPTTPPTQHKVTHNAIDINYYKFSVNSHEKSKGALVFLPDRDYPLASTSSTAAKLAHIANQQKLDFILPCLDTSDPEHIHAIRTFLPSLTSRNLVVAGTGTGATAITQHLTRTLLRPFMHLNTTFIIHGPNSRSMPTLPESAHKWRINATMVFAHTNIHDTSKHLFDALGHPTRHLNTSSFTGAVEEVLDMRGVIR